LAKKKDKQVILNMISGLALNFSNFAIFFFLTPYMYRELGEKIIGAWALIGSLTGYMALLQGTTTSAMTKYVAEYHAKKDHEKLLEIINSGIVQYLMISVAVILAGTVLCFLTGLFPPLRDSGSLSQAKIALAIMIANLAINLPFIGIRATIAGLQRYEFINGMEILKSLALAGGIVIVILLDYGLIGLAASNVIISMVSNIIQFLFLRRILPIRFARKYCKRNTIKMIFHFGIFTFIISFAALLHYYTDNIVMASMSMFSLNIIAAYNLGFRLLDSIKKINLSLTTVLMPVASEISTLPQDQKQFKLEELFTRASRFSAIFTLPPVLFLIVFGKQFIKMWQYDGYPYVYETYWIFTFLIIPHIFIFTQYVGPQMLIGLGKHKLFAYMHLVLALLNLGLSIFLARYYGIFGIALGTAIPLTISRPFMHFYFKNAFEISMKRYYWNVWSRLVPLAILLTGLLILCKYTIAITNLPLLLTLAAIYGAIFWLISYWTLDSYEREVIKHILSKLTGKSYSPPQSS
jgi:O-antigen/teichoic acid export membrane protein